MTHSDNGPHILVHQSGDNVGVVVVENLQAGIDAQCVVIADDSSFTLRTRDAAPIGHKLALRDLAEGDTAVKYGQDIGRMHSTVARGEHVHVHNLKTKKW